MKPTKQASRIAFAQLCALHSIGAELRGNPALAKHLLLLARQAVLVDGTKTKGK